jgi:hypothetical protein
MATQVSVKLNVKVNIDNLAEFNHLLSIYCGVMNQSMALVVKNTARLFCRDMVQYTPPFSGGEPSSNGRSGMDSVAQKTGQKKVSSQIRRIFAPLAQASPQQVAEFGNIGVFNAWKKAKEELPGRPDPYWVFQRWGSHRGLILGEGEFNLFQEWVKNGKKPKKATFINGTTEGNVKSIHEALRGKPTYNVKKTDHKYYVDDFKVVERYIKNVQGRVGRLKSGWYYAGKALGKMPNVAWISNQGSQDRICMTNFKGNRPVARVGTQGRERYRRWWPLMQKALNHRAFVMRNRILHHLKNPRNHGTLRQVIAQMPQGFNVLETKD